MTPDSIAEVLQHPVARAVAWSLVHFVWQGTLIGCAAALALSLLRAAGSEARYLVACAALVLMALAPPITTWVVLDRPPSTAVSPVAAVVPGPAAPHAAADSAAITSPASASNQTATLQGILASWLPSILGAWFVGVLLLSVRLTAGWALLQRRLSRECLSAGEAWDARLADLAARLGLTRAVRLRVSSSLAVPCAVGWWRPLVLLPTSALAGLTPAPARLRLPARPVRTPARAPRPPGPTGDLRVRVIHATMKMGNEYERANLLVASTKGTTFDPATRKAYLDAASSLKSEYERNRALAAIARM